VDAAEDDIEVYCDKDMVEKILTNLLSNAFKFTGKGGRVIVCIQTSLRGVPQSGTTKQSDNSETERLLRPKAPRNDMITNEHVELSVADTGVGIAPDQLDKVFDRFYQVDASQTREHEGSGIGLALVKELVELHHGRIDVQSEAGKGTTFTVRLPLGRSHLRDDEIVEVSVGVESTMREAEGALVDMAVEGVQKEADLEQARGERPIVLVVEDNADVRKYITGYLAPSYQVVEAKDGAEGIEKARECVPDLVISDVMMPKKDGYEVCRDLKLDERTSHIPIILLTAKAASENRIEGLETGADDYLIKPFDPKELLARIKNLIDVRRKLRERFKVSVPLRPGEIAVTSMDDSFLKKVMTAVEQHLGDEQFNVEELSALVSMSRVQLHRKLTALTNQPPGEFIRYLRLHRAMELLQKGAGTVSEIAYQVGFSDHSYFSKCFRQQFGMVPTDVRNSAKLAENSAKRAQNPS
jgi:DNA-binding response OmpR family regulator